MQKAVVIVAGGSGLRMGTELPKQFLPLHSLPILFRTIKAFASYDAAMQIVVAAPKSHFSTIEDLVIKHQFKINFELAEGGATRFLSVKNGLQKIRKAQLVGFHDAVRPLVSQNTIHLAYQSANEFGSGIPTAPVVDSLRKVEGNQNNAVDRNSFRIIQTPQVFQTELINAAFEAATRTDYSDDATVLEAYGKEIKLTDGNRENIKITTPVDLKLAHSLFEA